MDYRPVLRAVALLGLCHVPSAQAQYAVVPSLRCSPVRRTSRFAAP